MTWGSARRFVAVILLEAFDSSAGFTIKPQRRTSSGWAGPNTRASPPDLVRLGARLPGDLKRRMAAVYDDTPSIGKLYRRQDEIGTPFCVTVDVESLTDGAATIRERDSMTQERVPLRAD